MQTLRLQLTQYYAFRDLPFDELNGKKFSIYIVDYEWNYLYANHHAIKSLGLNPVGKNVQTIWKENPSLNFQPIFGLLKNPVSEKKPLDLNSRSPFTKKAIEIVGHPMSDCYYFSVYELPDKESLLSELKSLLKKGK